MRICFISHGQFTHIGAYLDYFKAAGHTVSFISLSPTHERGVPTYNTGFGTKYSASKGKWKYPLSALRSRWLIKKLKPDIVHAHYATSGGLASLVCGFHPIVVTVHGSDLMLGMKSRVWKRLLPVIFNNADCINTVSDALKDMTLQLGVPLNKIQTLTLGIDTNKFYFSEHLPISKGQPLQLICTRQMEKHYGHTTIIKALGILKRHGIDFHITFVGEGSQKNELERLVKNGDLADRAYFLGTIDNYQLPEILHKNDVYLSASLRDGTSLSLLEAMATGIFPVVSNIKANSAWIRHGKDGFLHEVGNADDLANCILQLLDQPEIAKEARKRNRKHVVEKGDRSKNMKQLNLIYEEQVRRAHMGKR
jgi:glycosyltransferase involved in cell wall biosynthesis